MDDKCPACGKLYSLVGRVHRCSGSALNVTLPVANTVANSSPVANTVANSRYRDLDKRRQYMRDLMRKRRQHAKAQG